MCRDLPPVRFVERFQCINTNALKLRADQPVEQIGSYPVSAVRENNAAVTSRQVIKFCA
jgi:hypothetical protein